METTTEQVVSLPIINPDTGVVARRKYMGKVDRVEGHKLIDWKGVAKPSRFIAQMRIGYQVELYALGANALGHDIHEVEYRLVSRPSITMCGKDKKESEKTGLPIHEVYEERCFEWLVDDPGKLVAHPYMITEHKLQQARWYLWESSRRLLENRRCKRWIPNTHACFAYERECQFMALCDAVQNGADYNWIIEQEYRVSDPHRELGGKADDKTVTHSSLKNLHFCEMFYYWMYEQSLRKGTGEDSEAMWIGSAMHAGQEHIDKGLDVALAEINAWAEDNPVMGEDQNHKQLQDVARARAMVRASAVKWPVEVSDDKA